MQKFGGAPQQPIPVQSIAKDPRQEHPGSRQKHKNPMRNGGVRAHHLAEAVRNNAWRSPCEWRHRCFSRRNKHETPPSSGQAGNSGDTTGTDRLSAHSCEHAVESRPRNAIRNPKHGASRIAQNSWAGEIEEHEARHVPIKRHATAPQPGRLRRV